jgi:hypothetical protein
MISRQTGVARIAPTSGWMTRRPERAAGGRTGQQKEEQSNLRITGSPKDAFHMQ